VLSFQVVATERAERPFSIVDLSRTERESFRNPIGLSWLPGARLLVTPEPVSITLNGPKKVIAVCDEPFDNVPRRLFGKSPLSHAVAFSDGTTGLLSVADFKRSDFSRFVDVTTIPQPDGEPNDAANRRQPVGSETTNSTSSSPGSR
jgi:hypothetical protein